MIYNNTIYRFDVNFYFYSENPQQIHSNFTQIEILRIENLNRRPIFARIPSRFFSAAFGRIS